MPTKTMQAVICHGPEDYRLEERPVPEPGPGEVMIRVESVGICASDIKCYLGASLFWGDEHRIGYCQPPVIPGHEFVGKVVALGEGAGEKYGLKIGDRAVSEQIVPCWKCRYCQRGQYLDVPSPRYLWLPPAHLRSDGGVHDLSRRCAELQSARTRFRRSTPPSSNRLPAPSTRCSAGISNSRTWW